MIHAQQTMQRCILAGRMCRKLYMPTSLVYPIHTPFAGSIISFHASSRFIFRSAPTICKEKSLLILDTDIRFLLWLCSMDVHNAYNQTVPTVLPLLRKLIDAGYRMWIYRYRLQTHRLLHLVNEPLTKC